MTTTNVGPMKAGIDVSLRFICDIEREGATLYYGKCPELPGVHVEGGTLDEVMTNLRDACSGYVRSIMKHELETMRQIIELKEPT